MRSQNPQGGERRAAATVCKDSRELPFEAANLLTTREDDETSPTLPLIRPQFDDLGIGAIDSYAFSPSECSNRLPRRLRAAFLRLMTCCGLTFINSAMRASLSGSSLQMLTKSSFDVSRTAATSAT